MSSRSNPPYSSTSTSYLVNETSALLDMPPRKPREAKSTAPSPSPAATSRASSGPRGKKAVKETVVEVEEQEQQALDDEDDAPPAVEEEGDSDINDNTDDAEAVEGDAEAAESSDAKGKGKASMADRLAKMRDLRTRMVRLHLFIPCRRQHLTSRINQLKRTEKT